MNCLYTSPQVWVNEKGRVTMQIYCSNESEKHSMPKIDRMPI